MLQARLLQARLWQARLVLCFQVPMVAGFSASLPDLALSPLVSTPEALGMPHSSQSVEIE